MPSQMRNSGCNVCLPARPLQVLLQSRSPLEGRTEGCTSSVSQRYFRPAWVALFTLAGL